MNKIYQSYIKSVKKQLICKTAESKKMLRELKSEVEEFLQQNPNADTAQVEERFGTPEEIAKAYLSDTEPQNIKKAINIRKVLLAAVAIALAMLTITFIITIIDNHSGKIVYYESGAIEEVTELQRKLH